MKSASQHSVLTSGTWQRLTQLGCALALTLCVATSSWAEEAASDTQELFKQGLKAFNNGNYEEALGFFDKSIAQDSEFVDGYYNKGVVHYQLKQYNEALKAFNTVLQKNPNDFAARYNLGLVYKKSNQSDKAIAAFELIPSSHPRYEDAQRNIRKIREGSVGDKPMNKPENKSSVKTAVAEADSETTSPENTTSSALETEDTPPSKAATATPKANNTASASSSLLSGGAAAAGVHKAKEYAGGFSGPTGIVTDAQGNLFVANFSKNTIYKVEPTGQKNLFAAGAGINGPVGMTVDDETGNLYIANHLDNTVAQITPNGTISIIAKDLKKPYNIYFDKQTKALFVSQQGTNSIAKIDLVK